MSLAMEGESLTGNWLGFNCHKAGMMFSVCMAYVNTLLESLIIKGNPVGVHSCLLFIKNVKTSGSYLLCIYVPNKVN